MYLYGSKLVGDVNDLPRGLTCLNLSCSTLTGEASGLPPGIESYWNFTMEMPTQEQADAQPFWKRVSRACLRIARGRPKKVLAQAPKRRVELQFLFVNGLSAES